MRRRLLAFAAGEPSVRQPLQQIVEVATGNLVAVDRAKAPQARSLAVGGAVVEGEPGHLRLGAGDRRPSLRCADVRDGGAGEAWRGAERRIRQAREPLRRARARLVEQPTPARVVAGGEGERREFDARRERVVAERERAFEVGARRRRPAEPAREATERPVPPGAQRRQHARDPSHGVESMARFAGRQGGAAGRARRRRRIRRFRPQAVSPVRPIPDGKDGTEQDAHMVLRGDLASVDLAQVFQMLALNKKVGLLSIHAPRATKALYFDHRGVTLHHNVHQALDRVIAALARAGRLAEAAVEEVRDHVARTGQGLTDGLLAGGYVDLAELEEQYRSELEEQIYELFFCREAKFEFHENQQTIDGRDDAVDERFFFNCDSIIMEAARRIDEWTFIHERVPTVTEAYVAIVDVIDADEYGPEAPAVFQLLDGRRNVARVIETSGLTNFQVCKALGQLLDASAIAPVAPEELPALGDECLAVGRVQDAISLCERAIELGVGLPDVHGVAAKAYAAVQQFEASAQQLRHEASARLAVGDRAAAAARLAEARALLPTDLQARERLVALTIGPDAVELPGFDGMAEGKELVELLTAFGDIQRVRGLLEQLLVVAPGDLDLKKALVNVHLKAGDQERVVELYESIAADLVRQQKPLDAVAYLQKILLIDRSRADVNERIRKLYEFDENTRRRSRAVEALSFAFALLLVFGAAYWWYDEKAAAAYAAIDVRDQLATEDFAGAYVAYVEFTATWPFTTSIAKAETELAAVAARRDARDARRVAAAQQKERERKALRDGYQQDWARHRALFSEGKAEESLAALTRVRELLARSDYVQDAEWGRAHKVEETHARLRRYLAEADQLAGEYAASLAAGDWRAARATALRLRAEFENTAAARRSPVPVRVVTRPAGAALADDGAPLTAPGGGGALTTPAIVLVEGSALRLDASLPGYRGRRIDVDVADAAEVDVVLDRVPTTLIDFGAPAQTAVALAEGWLAVGLRGGKLGIARADGSNARQVALGGSRTVEAAPVIEDGCAVFLSHENTIERLLLATGASAPGWPVTLAVGAATDLAVAAGRVAVVDREGKLRVWELSTGREALALPLEGAPSGSPTFDGRNVVVGVADGRVIVVDAIDGGIVAQLRAPGGLATRVIGDRGALYVGLVDGRMAAFDRAERVALWTAATGRTLADGEFVVTNGAVVVAGAERRLVAFDRTTGKEIGALTMAGEIRAGLRADGTLVFAAVRVPKTRTSPARDGLAVVDVRAMALAWEHSESDLRAGWPAVAGDAVAVPHGSGGVAVFGREESAR